MYHSQVGIFILRVGVAAMMLGHGWPKLVLRVQGRGAEWLDPLGWGPVVSLVLCVAAEFFCSLAVLLGLMTRLASLVLVVNFWVIVFVYGESSSWVQSELPVLYMLCFATLVCTGSGPLAIDRWLMRRLRCRGRGAGAFTSRTGERRDPS